MHLHNLVTYQIPQGNFDINVLILLHMYLNVWMHAQVTKHHFFKVNGMSDNTENIVWKKET